MSPGSENCNWLEIKQLNHPLTMLHNTYLIIIYYDLKGAFYIGNILSSLAFLLRDFMAGNTGILRIRWGN